MEVSRQAVFQDRTEAGAVLAALLSPLAGSNPVVLAIPRGGVIVAEAVSAALDCPLYVFNAQRIAAPGYPELSLGAVAEGRVQVIDHLVRRLLRVSGEEQLLSTELAHAELRRRRARYRRWRAPNDLAGRSVLLIDDGLASGATVRAAIQAIRERNPERLTLAVPAGAPATASALRPLVDNLVMPLAPVDFRTVGRCYENFDPAAEAEVLKALWRRSGVADATSERSPRERVGMRGEVNGRTVMLPVDGGMVAGDLAAPPQAWGVVIFAHGSGSNRQSPRNRYVAARLHRAGVATLLMDFLTEAESASGVGLLDFDLGVPARRLVSAAGWLGAQPETETLPVGLLGASAGVAAALRAGAEYPDRIQAVVGRSGRVDLAVDVLPRLRVPALLVVGQQDLDVLGLHRTARESGAVPPFDLVTVPGASHLFEEPDTLEAFVRITTGWLRRNLRFPS